MANRGGLNELLMKFAEQDKDLGSVGHHDEGRSAVSFTAKAAAAIRALETEKGEKGLFNDPFATALAGGPETLNIFRELRTPNAIEKVAIRTRYIDDQITEAAGSIHQLVIVGAGLDARAYRLASLKDFAVFEIDFPEVFQYKGSVLKDAPLTCKSRVEATVNLALPNWKESFIALETYDASKPTFWLLEGLIGYLTEEEARNLLISIRSLSAPGSRLLATFLGANPTEATSMHKFFTDEPAQVLKECGWPTTSQLCSSEVAKFYEQYANLETFVPKAYFFAKASVGA